MRSSAACSPPFRKRSGRQARHSKAGPPQSICSSRLAFELMDVAAIDGDLPRLHGLGNLPNQFDLQLPVVEGGVLDLDVVGQVELPLEVPDRDTGGLYLIKRLIRWN